MDSNDNTYTNHNIGTKVNTHVPSHVAVIMDGNGRWAQAKGLERSAGHVEGVSTVRRITEAASKAGVRYLTLYTFSTENWNRPQYEVDMLMHLIVTAIERETPDLIKNNVRLSVIGDTSRVPWPTALFRPTLSTTGLSPLISPPPEYPTLMSSSAPAAICVCPIFCYGRLHTPKYS